MTNEREKNTKTNQADDNNLGDVIQTEETKKTADSSLETNSQCKVDGSDTEKADENIEKKSEDNSEKVSDNSQETSEKNEIVYPVQALTPSAPEYHSKKTAKKLKKGTFALIAAASAVFFVFGFCAGKSNAKKSEEKLQSLTSEKAQLVSEKNDLTEKNKELEKSKSSLEAKVKEAQPWFDMQAEEQQKIKDEENAKKQAEEEKEKQKKDEEEKKGYDTGITYDSLARNPDDYKGKKIKFSGKVIQVIEGGDTTQIRLAVNNNYNKVILCNIPKGTTSSRILENDKITVYGVSLGIITYESTLGASITIPAMSVDKIN